MTSFLRRFYIGVTALITSTIAADAAVAEVVIAGDSASLKGDSVSLRGDSIMAAGDVQSVEDSMRFSQLPWYKQVVETGFHIHDPRIDYPKFMRFLLKIYDWGDRTFNSYDPEYVVGTGKNWKAMLRSYNWMESYMMMFSLHTSDMLHIRSELFSDLGVHLSFMAVSIGYTANFNNILGKNHDRSNFNFNFTSSRFSANIDVISTKGDTRITKFGRYDKNHDLNYKFNDINHDAVSGEFYYFFNHLKYSRAAAYCYSKYQLKSAGSAIVGFAFNSQTINMDFSSLPQDMKDYLPSLDDKYRFRFNDYAIIGGYGHNWVLYPRRWLINLTLIPSVGFRHSYSGSTEGSRNMVATNLRARFAVVYNHRALFASLNGRFDGNLFFNSKYTFFNSTESLSLIVGMRF